MITYIIPACVILIGTAFWIYDTYRPSTLYLMSGDTGILGFLISVLTALTFFVARLI